MHWHKLTDKAQLEALKESSYQNPVVIFKHSTRCSISAAALDRIERSWQDTETLNAQAYYLDLIQYRELSSAIAEQFSIEHESPQVLVLKNGGCTYHASHFDIRYPELLQQLH